MMIDENKLIDTFLSLVRIDAVSLRERKMRDYLSGRLVELNIEFREDDAALKIGGECGNIIARLDSNVQSDTHYLLMAHMDTVASTSALEPVVENGVIRSGGSTILGADDRAGIAVILYALDALRSNGVKHCNVDIVFSVAEELGMLGSTELDLSGIKARQGYILDCSRKVGCYVRTTPTAIDFKVNLRGRSAHSGVSPEKGINAISMAVDFTRRIPVGRLDEDTVANVGTIQGGTAINVVPEHVQLTGEIRSFSRDKIIELKRNMEDNARVISKEMGGEIELSYTTGFEGFLLDRSKAVIKHLEEEMRLMNIEPDPLKYYGGSDANVLNAKGIDTVNLGIGVQNPHSKDEHIEKSQLVKSAELVMRLLTLE
ncbi:MAG: M20/M25/M40 family metallo-hydrolase [candidate division KSB1 bacterium]|jgi:tripeptide aminopeptidase|nr:M20/M25/M40 family metallo-hydrolase [candidate division KSB1 bacterium]